MPSHTVIVKIASVILIKKHFIMYNGPIHGNKDTQREAMKVTIFLPIHLSLIQSTTFGQCSRSFY